MNLLLDTHIALWALNNHPKLAERAKGLIADDANAVTISVATLWEIAIKHPLNRKGASGITISAATALELFEGAGYRILPVNAAHAAYVETLPVLHGDPFDRLLVAQALTEPLRLVTHDAALAAYSDSIILV